MNHLKDNSKSELDILLDKLKKKKISYRISVRENKVVSLQTDDKELIKLAKENNSNLK
tara:strand:+ start:1007 stop:1180 length:174 start_codon:yes stop_codon:yes gene_type:complete